MENATERNTKNLDKLYESFIKEENSRNFYIGLTDYAEYIFRSVSLEKFIKGELLIRGSLLQGCKDVENRVFKEIYDSEKKLLKIVQKRRLDIDSFVEHEPRISHLIDDKKSNLIQKMELVRNKSIRDSRGLSDKLLGLLFDIARNIAEAGYEEDLKEFLLPDEQYREYMARVEPGVSKTNIYGNFIFSKSWPEIFEQMRKIEARSLEWEHFVLITQIHLAYQEFSLDSKEQESTNKIIKDNKYNLTDEDIGGILLMIHELKRVLLDGHHTGRPQFYDFRKPEIKNKLKRVNFALGQYETDSVKNTEHSPFSFITYNPETGEGEVRGKGFRFRINTPGYRVFTEAYKKRGKKVPQGKILELMKFYDKNDPTIISGSAGTNAITKLVVKMRLKTGLSPKELVQNDKSLILVGKVD